MGVSTSVNRQVRDFVNMMTIETCNSAGINLTQRVKQDKLVQIIYKEQQGIKEQNTAAYRRIKRLYHSMQVPPTPTAHVHTTSRTASSSPASQCRSPIGRSTALNRRTSLTVTRPFNDPCSSTSMTRGLLIRGRYVCEQGFCLASQVGLTPFS
jgi:hypothetical protein